MNNNNYPEIGDYYFTKKFAFLPKRLVPFDLRNGNIYRYIHIWLIPYYEVYRYKYITWAVPPKIGWSFDGYATKKIKKEIIISGRYIPLYGKDDFLLKNEEEVKSENEKHRQRYELKVKEVNEDKWLQGLIHGLKINSNATRFF